MRINAHFMENNINFMDLIKRSMRVDVHLMVDDVNIIESDVNFIF